MVRPSHLIVLLLAVCLSGCGGYAMFDPSAAFTSPGKQADWAKGGGQAAVPEAADYETTETTPAASSKPESTAQSSLFTQASETKLAAPPAPVVATAKPITVADAADISVPVAPAPQAVEKITQPRGRAYLFRGVAGLIYSRGIDTLAARIRRTGIPASVGTYLLWRPTLDEAIRDYRRDPQPIILIGHSMGGDCVLDFAEMLNQAGIPVSLLVTYDPTRIADDVPPNVERYINIYQSSNFMGGGNVVQGSRFHGDYASYNLKDHAEIVHINIEKADRIQEQLVAKVAQLAQTPADAQGEAVPIHLEVPADAAIELWDSGLPVAAHAGDTLKTLAATYHVPLWALAQINSVPEREPLSEGQRIVVPRHLVPMQMPSTVTSYAPAGR
ncbi:MAG TPA: LysM peptidoglycan-binding domain-containing protein [Xanthobacteraceae bacterium]|nr:LysM peptidoglycan-binding domain-containing protein [Xanthobacteraceae bacterium]